METTEKIYSPFIEHILLTGKPIRKKATHTEKGNYVGLTKHELSGAVTLHKTQDREQIQMLERSGWFRVNKI